jgi:hypothetical protein
MSKESYVRVSHFQATNNVGKSKIVALFEDKGWSLYPITKLTGRNIQSLGLDDLENLGSSKIIEIGHKYLILPSGNYSYIEKSSFLKENPDFWSVLSLPFLEGKDSLEMRLESLRAFDSGIDFSIKCGLIFGTRGWSYSMLPNILETCLQECILEGLEDYIKTNPELKLVTSLR